MTPETERHIRSLAANEQDLRRRIAMLKAVNTSAMELEESQQVAGDLAVAHRALHEATVELRELTFSSREVGP